MELDPKRDERLIEALHRGRRIIAAQCAFFRVRSLFRPQERAAAALLASSVPAAAASGLAQRLSVESDETDIRRFVLHELSAAPRSAVDGVGRQFGSRPLTDKALADASSYLSELRKAHLRHREVFGGSDVTGQADHLLRAEVESNYYVCAQGFSTHMMELKRKGFDVSKIEGAAAREHMLERFLSMNIPMHRGTRFEEGLAPSVPAKKNDPSM